MSGYVPAETEAGSFGLVLNELDLNDGNKYAVMPNPSFDRMSREITEIAGSQGDISMQADTHSAALRVLEIPLRIMGDTKDELIANINLLATEVMKDSGTLTVTSANASYAVSFNVVKSQDFQWPTDFLSEIRKVAIFTIRLTVEPYAYGSLETPISASQHLLPTYADLEDMKGNVAPPLDITFAKGGSQNLHGLYVGITPDADWDGYLTEAEALTWTGGNDATDSYAHGGWCHYTTSTSYVSAPFEVMSTTHDASSDFQEGHYLILARVKSSEGTNGATFYTSMTSDDEITTTSTTWELVQLGEAYIPAQETEDGTGLTATIYMKKNTSGSAYIDYLGFLPLTWGAAWYHNSSASGYCQNFHLTRTTPYVDGVAAYTYLTGHAFKAMNGRLILFGDEPTGTNATIDTDLTVKYTPRYSLFRHS